MLNLPVLLHLVTWPSCLVLRAGDWGFGSQMVHLLHALTHAPNLVWDYQASPYTCCSSCGSEHSWLTLFNSSTPVRTLDQPAGRRCVTMGVGEVVRWNRQSNSRSAAPARLCSALRKVWLFSNHVNATIQHELETFARLDRPRVVLQVRGGDKTTGVSAEAEMYTFDNLASLAPHASGGTCIILGDDARLADALAPLAQRALGCRVVSRIEPGSAHNQSLFNTQSSLTRCLSTRKLLTDIELIAAADATAGLAMSNVYRLGILRRFCAGRYSPKNTVDWQSRDPLREASFPF